MVYCGRPSKACHACRKRNTRCDAKPQGCSQCKAARRECPGYRAPLDLIFRDESSKFAQLVTQSKRPAARDRRKNPAKSVVKIAPLQEDKAVEPLLESTSDPADDLTDLVPFEASEALRSLRSPSLVPSLEDNATCFFINNHIVGMHATSFGFLDCLVHLYKTHSPDPCLVASVKAASLGSYAHHEHNDELVAMSRRQYMQAIQLTNTALGSSEEVKKDSTLVATIILGLYETIAGDDQRSKAAWEKHVNGAAALLKVRGPAQLTSPFGRDLLVKVMRNSILTCCMRSIRMPEHLSDLVRSASLNAPDKSIVGRLYKAFTEVVDFCAFVRSKRVTNYKDVVSRALLIERPLADVCVDPPPFGAFQSFYDDTASPDIVFHGRYDTYERVGWSNIWDGIRLIRILLHEGIQDALIQSFPSAISASAREQLIFQFRQSRTVCEQMRLDILASVPQRLGYISQVDGKPVLTSTPTTWPARAYGVLWSLWVCGRADTTTEVRKYCIRCVRDIGRRMGIRQGFVLARELEDLGQGDYEGGDRLTRFEALVEQADQTFDSPFEEFDPLLEIGAG